MAKTGPLIVVEDDADDRDVLSRVIEDVGLPNEVIFFNVAAPALEYLKTTKKQPFLILCDINLPRQTGLDFKKQIDADPQLRRKSIPFIFFSTTDDSDTVTDAYTKMTVQGFFKKPVREQELKDTIMIITEYWKLCRHPNSPGY